MKVGAGDAVAVLEAAYDLDSDDAEWLRRVSHAIASVVDQGLGVASYIGQVEDVFVIKTMAGSLGLEAAQANLTEPARSREFVQRVFCGTPGYYSMRAIAGPAFAALARTADVLRNCDASDVAFVRAMNLDGAGCVFGSPARKRVKVVDSTARRGHRLALHVAAAFRLRRSLAAIGTAGEAVFEPGGKLLHAEGEARGISARAALRSAVIAVDKARGRLRREDNESAVDLWRGLVEAQWSLIDRFERDGRRFVVAHRNQPPVAEHAALTSLERQVAAHVAAGLSNKLIAYGLGVSEGTASTAVAKACAKLGLRRRLELVALGALLGVRWSKHAGSASGVSATTTQVGWPPADIAFAASEGRLELAGLTPAQRDVARLIVAGHSPDEIAAHRGVSKHTISNQIAAIYRRLGVDGRHGLVALMTRPGA